MTKGGWTRVALLTAAILAGPLALGPSGSPTQAAAPAGTEDWSTFHHDRRHTGVSAETTLGAANAASLTVHWKQSTGTKSFSSPAIVYNNTLGKALVYVGNQGGRMAAYDTAGNNVWSYQVKKVTGLSKNIETSPAVVGNTVYFGASDHNFYALNATTGAFICSFATTGNIAAAPMVVNPDGTGNVVYFADSGPSGDTSDGGNVWAINAVGSSAGGCTLKWQFNAFGNPAGSQTGVAGSYTAPAYGKDANGRPVIIIGSTDPDDAVYALDAVTGALHWRFQTFVGTDTDVGAPATVTLPKTNGLAGGAVYVSGKAGFVYAINLTTGASIWTSKRLPNPTQSSAAVAGRTVYVGFGNGVIALDAVTGAEVWRTAAMAGVVSSPAISGAAGNQVLFCGDLAGIVHAFKLTDGSSLFSFTTGGLIFASPGVSTGQMFISSSDGFLYAFGL